VLFVIDLIALRLGQKNVKSRNYDFGLLKISNFVVSVSGHFPEVWPQNYQTFPPKKVDKPHLQ
jgi:hypothetical protein